MTERDPGAESRENAEEFGDRVEDAAENLGDALDALRGKPDDDDREHDTSPGDRPGDRDA